MRVLLQRVSGASVTIDGAEVGAIGKGVLLLVGVTHQDSQREADFLADKCANLRVFDDENGVMNRSLLDVGGEALVVSQFTLHASTRKGNRPSYIRAARPETAVPLYRDFIDRLNEALPKPCGEGEFGADMQVALVNDGPVTIIIDSHLKE